MQELQPMVKELQRKHGKDKQRLQEETIKLYREQKVNPVGGCLPMLLQLPIFIGVYQAVIHLMIVTYRKYLSPPLLQAVEKNNIEPLLNESSLAWLWQLSGLQDPTMISRLLQEPFVGLDLGTAVFTGGLFEGFAGPVYLILPVLSVLLQVMQQLMALPRVQDPQQKAMAQMMMFMPLIFVYIALIFPQGAVLYWVTSGAVGVTQQYFISGWGSLANHLKFLPLTEREKRRSAALMAASGEGGSTATASAVEGGSAGAAVATAPRTTFWDVMRPLVDEGAGSGSQEAQASTSDAAAPGSTATPATTPADEPARANDQATEGTRRQPRPRPNSRRRGGRRR
jgi:YidC/Oxa1 family membrane protein insertase